MNTLKPTAFSHLLAPRLERLVHLLAIGPVVALVVHLQRVLVDERLESVVRVGQIGQGIVIPPLHDHLVGRVLV